MRSLRFFSNLSVCCSMYSSSRGILAMLPPISQCLEKKAQFSRTMHEQLTSVKQSGEPRSTICGQMRRPNARRSPCPPNQSHPKVEQTTATGCGGTFGRQVLGVWVLLYDRGAERPGWNHPGVIGATTATPLETLVAKQGFAFVSPIERCIHVEGGGGFCLVPLHEGDNVVYNILQTCSVQQVW